MYDELKAIGCTDENYREKYKETITYKNYTKLKNVIKQEITSSSDNELKNINHVLNTEYKETHLPKISNNKFDVEIYKNKVNKFIDNVCHDFIKKYGGILTAYLNDFKTFNNKI